MMAGLQGVLEIRVVAILRDAAHAAPQDEDPMLGLVPDPHGEEHGEAVRLEPSW